jgi:hypothetical protein
VETARPITGPASMKIKNGRMVGYFTCRDCGHVRKGRPIPLDREGQETTIDSLVVKRICRDCVEKTKKERQGQ